MHQLNWYRELLKILTFLSLQCLAQCGTCVSLSGCNGHGTCIGATDTCSCFTGWGSDSDVSYYKAPDCSLRTCPSGRAWADVPTSPTEAHALAECSNRGTCDRNYGVCSCVAGFEGSACQRMKCPKGCSGHGQCLPLYQLAAMTDAMPLSPVTTYTGFEVRFKQ